jgi:hypothetical protein
MNTVEFVLSKEYVELCQLLPYDLPAGRCSARWRAADAHVATLGQADGHAVGAAAAGAADAVHVVGGNLGQVVVDHVADGAHVDAAGGHVGGDEHAQVAATQLVEGAGAHALVHVAVEGGHRVTLGCRGSGSGRRRHAWWQVNTMACSMLTSRSRPSRRRFLWPMSSATSRRCSMFS